MPLIYFLLDMLNFFEYVEMQSGKERTLPIFKSKGAVQGTTLEFQTKRGEFLRPLLRQQK